MTKLLPANTNTTEITVNAATTLGDFAKAVQSGKLSRKQIQTLMMEVLAAAPVPGGEEALKATRVARAFLHLASAAEVAAGYGEKEFLQYAKICFEKQVTEKGTHKLPSGGVVEPKALGHKVKIGHKASKFALIKMGK